MARYFNLLLPLFPSELLATARATFPNAHLIVPLSWFKFSTIPTAPKGGTPNAYQSHSPPLTLPAPAILNNVQYAVSSSMTQCFCFFVLTPLNMAFYLSSSSFRAHVMDHLVQKAFPDYTCSLCGLGTLYPCASEPNPQFITVGVSVSV